MTSRTSLLITVSAVWLLCQVRFQTNAAPNAIYHFRPGVHMSKEHPLTEKQLKTMLDGLRFWTGFREIGIDVDGDVTLGDRTGVTNGSITARELIIAAVDSHDSFTLENHDHSPSIAFERIESNIVYEDGVGTRNHDWLIQIDFSDFKQLRGNNQALAAFDPAINMLHELVHGVLGYPDSIDVDDQLGQCERYVNRIRKELGLPQRKNYYPRTSVMAETCVKKSAVQNELTFLDSNSVSKSKPESVLSFKADAVIDVSRAKSDPLTDRKFRLWPVDKRVIIH